MKKIAIIGSGSWGGALAIHAANLGNNVTIWSSSDEEANIINNERKGCYTDIVYVDYDLISR